LLKKLKQLGLTRLKDFKSMCTRDNFPVVNITLSSEEEPTWQNPI
jgi:hypothetical protein